MLFNFRISRRVPAGLLLVTLLAVTAAVAMGLMYPEPVSSGALGPDWQCTRLALVFTTCSPVVRFQTAAAETGKPACPRSSLHRMLGVLR
jgi:hypothetical protein